jgi:phosphatidylinositol glycan class Q protein
MSSPGGIKLNNELSAFLSDLFKWIIEFWKFILVDPFLPYYRHVVLLIAISSSTFGASLAISLFLDISSVMTFHIYCFYYSSAKIFNWLLNVLLSLFYLFWGKKRNVLRKRTDSNDYELDQLLLGTLLFTVVTFLLPTVLAFYVTFAVGELSIMIILATLEISNVMLNHFPIFVLLLRVKDPKRIPGEVQLINYMNYIKISSVPIGLDEMFDHFNNVFNKLKRDYLSKTTLFNIIKGKPIHVERTKLYKLLYSALPSTPISTGQLWGEINDSTPQAEPL